MKANKETWSAVSMHCPNCGKESQAHRSANGTIKSACSVCSAVVVRRKMSRRHTRLDLYVSGDEVK